MEGRQGATAPAHNLPKAVDQLKEVVDRACALVADWKAHRPTHGHDLIAAVDALDPDIAKYSSPWLAWALGAAATEALKQAEQRGYERAMRELTAGTTQS